MEGSFDRVLFGLKSLGFTPDAIIDIGVADGTKGLYDVWPEAPVVMIEPSENARPKLQALADSRPNTHFFACGASDTDGWVDATECPDGPWVAFNDRKPKWTSKRVEVRKCDKMVAETGLTGDFIYKLDTDSHDWEALHGSEWTLKRSKLAILEINYFSGFKGLATPDQIWRFMADHGFSLYDVNPSTTGGANRIGRGADFFFVKSEWAFFKYAYKNSPKSLRKVELT